MHPYTMLKELLRELGLGTYSEDLCPDVFGSYVATYSYSKCPIRLLWDGKDGWGFVQRRRIDGTWVDVTEPLTEGDLEGDPQNKPKINQFRQAVSELLKSGPN